MKRLLALAACLILAACTTTNAQVAPNLGAGPPAGARILILTPDVQLALLTASGVTETRPEWSTQGRDNILAEYRKYFDAKNHSYTVVAPETAQAGRVGQVLRLHQAVSASMVFQNLLPTHPRGTFNWTLGPGAATLRDTYNADYALFTTANGTYASSGRVLAVVAMSMVNVAMPMGQQQIYTSLVDLRTGEVVWFNTAIAGSNADMRSATGANSLLTTVLKTAPL